MSKERRIVRAALLQATWTGDKESMIEKHIDYARKAAQQGAQVMCFQELFYGPYFCQVQDPQFFSYTEEIPDGPTTKRMQELAKELNMVLVVPLYERDGVGVYYNTAAVIDADGTYKGKYRKTHIPHLRVSGKNSISVRATSVTLFSIPQSAKSESTFAMTVISRRRTRTRPQWCRNCLHSFRNFAWSESTSVAH